MKFVCCLIAGALAFAADGPEAPTIGYSRLSGERLARVSGIAGAIVVELEPAAGVESVAFSGRLLALKRARSIVISDARGTVINETGAPDGPAIFGFSSDGSAAVAFLERVSQFRIFENATWRTLDLRIEDRVQAAGISAPDQISVIIARDGLSLVRVRCSDGAIEEEFALPGARGPAAILPSGALLFLRGETVVLREGAVEREIGLPPEVKGFEMVGATWVQAETRAGKRFLIRVGPDLAVSELPEVEP